MQATKGQNVSLISRGAAEVDEINAQFYGRIEYPGPVQKLERVADADFWTRMLGQDIGQFEESSRPEVKEIWVAGCGRNQALITALKFPEARVLGTDLSAPSLATCQKNADAIGVRNLTLERKSINECTYVERFDYVICTGVLICNADPEHSIGRVSGALKPDGILEMMLYNEYHRFHTAAFQQAVRLLAGTTDAPDYEREIGIAHRMVDTLASRCSMTDFLSRFKGADVSHAYFADALMQPVEHSHTVETFDRLASAGNLEMLTFCIDQFSKVHGRISWNADFPEPALRERYLALPDVARWQITNLLLQEESPMLWFYLQRKDSLRPRLSEAQICERFLRQRFEPTSTSHQVWILQSDGSYRASARELPYPPAAHRPLGDAARILAALREEEPIGETFARLGLDTSFPAVHALRSQLATSAYPFLRARRE